MWDVIEFMLVLCQYDNANVDMCMKWFSLIYIEIKMLTK